MKFFAPRLIPGNGWLDDFIGELPFQFDLNIKWEQYMYYGFYEYEVIRFLKRALRRGGVVMDVGASIGYISAHMALAVGRDGAVHAFEPAPFAFDRLKRLSEQAMSRGYKIIANNSALGASEGHAEIQISRGENRLWNSIIPGVIPSDKVGSTEKVTLTTFSNYIKKAGVDPKEITLVKIDVEGAEPFVLQGMEDYLSTANRPMIVCEINPQTWRLIDIDPGEIFSKMRERYGYKLFFFQKNGVVPGTGSNIEKNGANVVWI